MNTKLNKKTTALLLSSFMLGFLVIKQVQVIENSKDLRKQDNIMKLSYEIIENANNIFSLQEEVARVSAKNDSFSFDIKDKAKMKEGLDNKNKTYKILNGLEKVSGRGVEIKVDGDILTEEIVDLINGIRNTKPGAIGINGRRVITRSYFIMNNKVLEFDDSKYNMPLTIQIVGDPESLKKSLDRTGGIMDILEKNSYGKLKFSLSVKDIIDLPAYNKPIIFKKAKITNF